MPTDVIEESIESQRYTILGSYKLSYVTATILATSIRTAVISFSPSIAVMKNLPPHYRALLGIAPLIPTVVISFPESWFVNRNGGKKETLICVGVTLSGMIMLTVLTAATDLINLEKADGYFGCLFISGVLIGHGTAAYQLITDTLRWVPKEENVIKLQTLYTFVFNFPMVIIPLLTYLMIPSGYFLPYTIYTGLVLASTLAAVIGYHPAPYNQLKKQFSSAQAKELAIEAGQLAKFLNYDDVISLPGLIKRNLAVMRDRRVLLLIFSTIATFGGFWVSVSGLPRLLIRGFGLGPSEAIYVTSGANFITVLTTPITTLILAKSKNKLANIYAHITSCTLMIGGSIGLSFLSIPPAALFITIAATNIGIGIGMVIPRAIALTWSKPVNQNLNEINPATIFSLFSALGTLGGIIFSIAISLMSPGVSDSGYQNYFYIIIALMAISAVGVPIVDYQVRHEPQESFFKNAVTFFRREPRPDPIVAELELELDPDDAPCTAMIIA